MNWPVPMLSVLGQLSNLKTSRFVPGWYCAHNNLDWNVVITWLSQAERQAFSTSCCQSIRNDIAHDAFAMVPECPTWSSITRKLLASRCPDVTWRCNVMLNSCLLIAKPFLEEETSMEVCHLKHKVDKTFTTILDLSQTLENTSNWRAQCTMSS